MCGQSMKYKFTNPHNVIFVTGSPLCGKTTIAPLVAYDLDNCIVQHMDVVRLLSQEVELLKPKSLRNIFVKYGSTDSYKKISDGKYSKKSLLRGYKTYARAVSRHLISIIAKLNPEDIDNMLVEGVQLMPLFVKKFLNREGYYLIVITATEAQFLKNTNKLFSTERLKKKYSVDKLKIIEDEFKRGFEYLQSYIPFVIHGL